MLAFVPALRAGRERFVVAVPTHLDKTLETDVPADLVPRAIEELEGQQPGDASVARRRGLDPFQAVGRFAGLDLRDGLKGFEHFRTLAGEELLLSPMFSEPAQRPEVFAQVLTPGARSMRS